MRTALIRVEQVAESFEARLAMDWDGRSAPDPTAPCNRFDAAPDPPEGFEDIATFMGQTPGGSKAFGDLGEAMNALLTGGGIGDELAAARRAGPLRLLLDVLPDTLRELPWELMRSGASLAFTNVQHPVARISSRYQADLDLLDMYWPLRVLLVIGTEDEHLNAEAEVLHIRDSFRRLCGFVDLEVLRLPNREQVQELAESMRPHVFHFSGHGAADRELGGYLRLDQRDDRPMVKWTAAALRDDLALAVPRLAILNACHTGGGSELGGTWAAAEGLMEVGVPAVIAMQGPILDTAAEVFARGFYRALSRGLPLDVAAARGRSAVTEVAPANRREYALPALILSAQPEQILDLSEARVNDRLSASSVGNARKFVDRVPKRRLLWERLRPDQDSPPRIVVVTGPDQAGKGEFVRWCLGMGAVWGHPVAHVDLSEEGAIDSIDFLDELAKNLPASIADAVPNGLKRLQAELAAFDARRKQAHADDAPFTESPAGLYQQLCKLLASATLDRSLLIGIDGLSQLMGGEWNAFAVPHLIKAVARGAAGRVRLVVALEPQELRARFRQSDFESEDLLEIRLELFPRDAYVEIISQYLRARDYVRSSFHEVLQEASDSRRSDTWTTAAFEAIEYRARDEGWQQE